MIYSYSRASIAQLVENRGTSMRELLLVGAIKAVLFFPVAKLNMFSWELTSLNNVTAAEEFGKYCCSHGTIIERNTYV